MTKTQAQREARRRWGATALVQVSPKRPGKYRVGILNEDYLRPHTIYGIGESWIAAFENAEQTRKDKQEETMGHIKKATVGQTFKSLMPSGAQKEYILQAACENKTDGRWYCVTHDQTFLNQFEKDSHTDTGNHALAWICLEHGPEEA